MAKKRGLDNKKFWFKRHSKDAKWGFVPLNWKGWISLALLVFLNIFSANYFDIMNSSFNGVSKFLVVFLLSLVVFILIAKRKTIGVNYGG